VAYVGRREGGKYRRSPNRRWDDSIIMDGKRTLSGCGLNLADSEWGPLERFLNSVMNLRVS